MLSCRKHPAVVLSSIAERTGYCLICDALVEGIKRNDPEPKILHIRRPLRSVPDVGFEPFDDKKFAAAIAKCREEIKRDPGNARLVQKLGELNQRRGDNANAAECFLSVAKIYESDGFALKAVGIYKNVLKLDPTRVDVKLRLATLYEQLGLMSEAMGQFQLVSAHYEKIGDAQSNLDLLERMVKLDPDNVASRIKLAEALVRGKQLGEAVVHFQKAAEYLERNKRFDDYVKVVQRLVYLDPQSILLCHRLARLSMERGDFRQALKALQPAFKADPQDLETLHLLAEAFKGLGHKQKVASVYAEIARLHERRGDREAALLAQALADEMRRS
jgi:tetratricopeptide (TPR) repeat protein